MESCVLNELKDFKKLFDRIAYGKVDSVVFDDFLKWIISNFSLDIKWEPMNDYSESKDSFGELLSELLKIMDMILNKKKWYDPFGHLYEVCISSFGQRSAAGQYFTSETIVDAMVESLIGKKDLTGAGLKILDPSCGSGRMLIAFHAEALGNYMYGEDIDQTCCLMSVCNLLLHGAVGEIVWHNSLDPLSYFGGWVINEYLNLTGIPMIRSLKKSESYIYNSALSLSMTSQEKSKNNNPHQLELKFE